MEGGSVTLSAEARGEILQAFSNALKREVHNLFPSTGYSLAADVRPAAVGGGGGRKTGFR